MKKLFLLPFIITLFCFAKCKKDKLDSNGLPPATQEGKNTLGFMLNGQPWTPKGFNGTANLSIYYDKTFRGGVFNISAYRILNSNGDSERITIASDSIQHAQTIMFGSKNLTIIFRNMVCDYQSNDSSIVVQGNCTISKLDIVNRIFSGTFQFTLLKNGCETINITDGRFDMKY